MGGAWCADGGGGPRLPTGGRRADHAAARTAAVPAGRMPGGAMARPGCRPANERGGGGGAGGGDGAARATAGPRQRGPTLRSPWKGAGGN